MQGRGNARFPCTPSPKPKSTTKKNRLAARTGKKLGCGNDVRWNPWKSPTPTFPPLPPHLEIPQQTRDSHIPTATTTTGYRGLDQHQTKFNTKFNTKINTNNKTKVVYTDNLTHPPPLQKHLPFSLPLRAGDDSSGRRLVLLVLSTISRWRVRSVPSLEQQLPRAQG
jgi:hypothetical protein